MFVFLYAQHQVFMHNKQIFRRSHTPHRNKGKSKGVVKVFVFDTLQGVKNPFVTQNLNTPPAKAQISPSLFSFTYINPDYNLHS